MNNEQATAKTATPSQSKKPVAPVPDTASDDIDGCDVAVTSATLDHELPATKGGVA